MPLQPGQAAQLAGVSVTDAGTPDWLKGRSHDGVLATHMDYVRDAVERFKGRIDCWDIINGAHSWNNIHGWCAHCKEKQR